MHNRLCEGFILLGSCEIYLSVLHLSGHPFSCVAGGADRTHPDLSACWFCPRTDACASLLQYCLAPHKHILGHQPVAVAPTGAELGTHTHVHGEEAPPASSAVQPAASHRVSHCCLGTRSCASPSLTCCHVGAGCWRWLALSFVSFPEGRQGCINSSPLLHFNRSFLHPKVPVQSW